MPYYNFHGDTRFSDLFPARNDPLALKDFLLQSELKFDEENIVVIIDGTRE
jgi:hypothetical protein